MDANYKRRINLTLENFMTQVCIVIHMLQMAVLKVVILLHQI